MAQHYDDLFQRSPRSFNTHISEFSSSHFQAPMTIFNLLPTGLTLLTGPARSGKTSLALHLALDVATGEPALNSCIPSLPDHQQPYRTSYGRVCYLALDSSDDYLLDLTKRLFAPRTINTNLSFTLTNTLDDLSSKEGFLNFHAQLTSPPINLLVIDNLAACRGRFKGSDRELLDVLRRLAEQCKISILVLHTARRSTPLAAHVDHHWHLSNLPISSYSRLETRCRGLKPRQHLLHCPGDTLSFRFASLSEMTSLNILSSPKILSPERLTILHLIHSSASPLSPRQLATALGFDYDCVRQILSQMHKSNLLTTIKHGRYTIHPFVKPLLPSLLEELPPLPLLALNEVPPDENPEIITPPSQDQSDNDVLLETFTTLLQLSQESGAAIPHNPKRLPKPRPDNSQPRRKPS